MTRPQCVETFQVNEIKCKEFPHGILSLEGRETSETEEDPDEDSRDGSLELGPGCGYTLDLCLATAAIEERPECLKITPNLVSCAHKEPDLNRAFQLPPGCYFMLDYCLKTALPMIRSQCLDRFKVDEVACEKVLLTRGEEGDDEEPDDDESSPADSTQGGSNSIALIRPTASLVKREERHVEDKSSRETRSGKKLDNPRWMCG